MKMEKTKMKNIEIIRSDRRKRTIQAREISGKLYVYLPSNMSKEEEKR